MVENELKKERTFRLCYGLCIHYQKSCGNYITLFRPILHHKVDFENHDIVNFENVPSVNVNHTTNFFTRKILTEVYIYPYLVRGQSSQNLLSFHNKTFAYDIYPQYTKYRYMDKEKMLKS